MRLCVLAIMVSLMAGSAIAEGFRFGPAKAAKARYDLIVEQADGSYRQQSQAAKKRFVAEMHVVRNEELTAGHLDVANQIDGLSKLSPTTRPAPLPTGTEAAYQHFESAIVKAADAWSAKVTPARKAYEAELLAAKEAVMKRADLEEANAIDRAIKELDAVTPNPPNTDVEPAHTAASNVGGIFLSNIRPVSYRGLGELAHSGKWRQPDGKLQDFTISVNGKESIHGLMIHPDIVPGERTRKSHATYDIGGRFTAFSGAVAINDTVRDHTGAPLTFNILGDGKTLWTSEPITNRGETQEFSVSVANVRRLEITVETPDGRLGHGVWIEPVLTR